MTAPGSPSPPKPPGEFARRFFADRHELVAARWWQEQMAAQHAAALNRRTMLTVLGGGGAVIIGAMWFFAREEDDSIEVSMDTLELQKKQGWNVGGTDQSLRYPNATSLDIAGRQSWPARELTGNPPSLVGAMAPASPELLPYYVPTLFQVSDAASFRSGFQLIHTDEMDRSFARGQALARIFIEAGRRTDTALIIDLPGPDAVAVAAGLCDQFVPVFLFDNWPHPRGVVASHEVIAAAVYLHPVLLAEEHPARPAAAAPAFILDSRRLTPYRDASDEFDNRYVARLPTPAAFRDLKIKHVLYVTAAAEANEQDDLNDDFVDLREAGIDVRMLALSDFRPLEGTFTGQYSYGGVPSSHIWFWRSYHWYGTGPLPARAPAPVGLSSTSAYQPVQRTTIFRSRTVGGLGGIGRQKPSGFGRVSVRTSPSTGAVSVGRSGSFGRVRFSSGG